MNNKTLIIVVGVVVIIGAIIGFMMMGKPSGEVSDKNQVAPQSGSQKMSMKSLLASGKPQTCTFSTTSGVGPDASSSGNIQMVAGKMRGDFTNTTAGKTTATHMIMIDNVNYIWGDEMPFGIKMALTDLEKPENQKNQAVDINKELDYTCNPGTSDSNAFSLPTGVEFKDLGAMMQGITPTTPNTTPGTNTSQCGMCDGAPDAESRAQCRTALGCK